MKSLQDMFVKETLSVDTGEAGRVYQLDESSVSPVIVTGFNKFGEPIEQTVCAFARWEVFVDPAGNICCVPLSTGRVMSMSPESERYEMIEKKDQICGGSLPLQACPFTTDYRTWTGGPLMKPESPSDIDCGGRPGATRYEDACEHMRAVIDTRRARNRERCAERERALMQMSPSEAAGMLRKMSAAFDLVGNVASGADERDPEPTPTVKTPKRHRVEGDR